jgi:hypothetical protein
MGRKGRGREDHYQGRSLLSLLLFLCLKISNGEVGRSL